MSARRSPAASARERLNAALADHLIDDFKAHGAEVIAKLRKDKPAEYLKMVTTAFQNQGAVPAVRAPSRKFAGQFARVYSEPSGPKEWRMPPEIDEFLRLTGQ